MDSRVIDTVLRKGGNIEDGKRRIYLFYKAKRPNTREFAVFLKNEYGIGGAHPAYVNGEQNYSWSTMGYCAGKKSGGLVIEHYTLKPYKTIEAVDITWTEVAERTASLIDSGSFMDTWDFVRSKSYWELRKLRWN